MLKKMENELDGILKNIEKNIIDGQEKGYLDLIYLIYNCQTDEENLKICLSFINKLINNGIVKEKINIKDYLSAIYCRNIINFIDEETKK